MSARIIKNTPKRLNSIFQTYDRPLYFVTINSWQRGDFLATDIVQDAFIAYANMNQTHNRTIGRYVIMPDHIHFFVRGDENFVLSTFVKLLKQHITKELKQVFQNTRHYWQPGFFDHILRNNESYAEKWNYVRDNPVRANLVTHADDWPHQGELTIIDRA